MKFIKFNFKIIFWLFIFCYFFLPTSSTNAQTPDGLALTIAPPLINQKMDPGQKWTSFISVVNNSLEPVDVYVDKQDFKSDENGGVKFIQTDSDKLSSANFLLSQWIETNPGPFTIPAQQKIDIPFTINVPEGAEPGGHYGALLVGNKPTENIKGSGIKISSLLASLILLQVTGDTQEHGSIREFSTTKTLYTEPNVDFTVRFENTGNIHLQPQGEIKLYDFIGKEAGSIAINQKSDYGNVLPKSIRKWNFSWAGTKALSAMGRYKAVLILGYGDQARETANQTLYFWVIFPKPIMLIAGSIFLVLLLLFLALKFYIRRAIRQNTSQAGLVNPRENKKVKISIIPEDNNGHELKTVITRLPKKEPKETEYTYSSLSKTMQIFLVLIIIIFSGLSYVYYRKNVDIKNNTNQTPVSIVTPASDAVINNVSKEITPESKNIETASTSKPEETVDNTSSITSATSTKNIITEQSAADPSASVNKMIIKILNGSGRPGVASILQKIIEQKGYQIASIGNADNYNYKNTLIKYKSGSNDSATDISHIFKDQYELQADDEQVEDIIIIIGQSYTGD